MESRYFNATITQNKTSKKVYIKVTLRKSLPNYTITIFDYDLLIGYYIKKYEISSNKIPVNISIDIKKKIADYYEVSIDKVEVSDEILYEQWRNKIKYNQN